MRIFLPSDDLEAGKDGDNSLAVLREAGLVHEKDINPGHTQEQVLHYGKVVVAPAQQVDLDPAFCLNADPCGYGS